MLYDPKWNNSVLRTLIEAREMVSDPAGWASCLEDLGQEGRHCLTTAFGNDFPAHTTFLRANSLDESSFIGNVIHFNDTHTHAEVLAALDRAIAFCSMPSTHTTE